MQELRLAADISRSIWGCVISTFDPDADDIPLSETAFTYSIYHYAILDVLKRYHLHNDVLDLFIPSASFLMQADPNDPVLAPTFGIMFGQVSSALRFFESDNLSPTSLDGARQILSQKYVICSDLPKTTAESFLGYNPTDLECHRYVNNARSLINNVEKMILSSGPLSSNYSHTNYSTPKKRNYFLIFSIILIAVFIIYVIYNFR